MKILDEKELAEIAVDLEPIGKPHEEDKDFLKSLEKMAEEIEDEPKAHN